MTYEQALEGIHSRKMFSSSASLERITRLLDKLGNPQNTYKTIHVAGTNGKGSTSAMIESVLRCAGYHTGLFTSPYLVDFRERIQLAGNLISKDALVQSYQTVIIAEKELEENGFEPVNEFEMVTAIGFVAFREAGIDIAVIEVGLGGRSDPTNVIQCPSICCLTPISFDHVAILGDSLRKIAFEKAGIIKGNTTVVVSRQKDEAMESIMDEVICRHAKVYDRYDAIITSRCENNIELVLDGQNIRLPLIGDYQAINAETAYTVCSALGIEKQTIKRGLECVKWPGRLQLIGGNILVDAAHNEDGIQSLCLALEQYFSDRTVIAIMAMMKDKDYRSCIKMVAKKSIKMYCTSVGMPRSLSANEICRIAGEYCEAIDVNSVSEAIVYAKKSIKTNDLIVICGSVYAAGHAISILK